VSQAGDLKYIFSRLVYILDESSCFLQPFILAKIFGFQILAIWSTHLFREPSFPIYLGAQSYVGRDRSAHNNSYCYFANFYIILFSYLDVLDLLEYCSLGLLFSLLCFPITTIFSPFAFWILLVSFTHVFGPRHAFAASVVILLVFLTDRPRLFLAWQLLLIIFRFRPHNGLFPAPISYAASPWASSSFPGYPPRASYHHLWWGFYFLSFLTSFDAMTEELSLKGRFLFFSLTHKHLFTISEFTLYSH